MVKTMMKMESSGVKDELAKVKSAARVQAALSDMAWRTTLGQGAAALAEATFSSSEDESVFQRNACAHPILSFSSSPRFHKILWLSCRRS